LGGKPKSSLGVKTLFKGDYGGNACRGAKPPIYLPIYNFIKIVYLGKLWLSLVHLNKIRVKKK